ncbi:MAG: S-layer family protein [Oscillatoriales cyanobacterium C42_A2020_001]|nr:S-layer family protein [Leptolyngbyaceae cyanobacterium C42_A2020_001]
MLRSLTLLTIATPLLLSGLLVSPALGQIAGDGSLGTQVNGSLTNPCNGGICFITNGSPRGSNLFHSFRQFSLRNPADFAAFLTAPTIQNVIVRVTGTGDPFVSTINGTIITSNPANFFLLNPNGIVFGPGASLNVGGSFLATTADRLLFQNGIEFRTTDSAPLLTVNVPIGLGFTGTPKSIQTRSSLLSTAIDNDFNSFTLVGGNIQLDNTLIQSPGQRVELGSVGAPGTVGLTLQNNRLQLAFPTTLARADIALTNSSSIDVLATGGGEIALTGRNITMSGNSSLNAGIAFSSDFTPLRSGDITLDATGAIAITGGGVFNQILQAFGVSGNIQINARSLTLQQGGQINTSNVLGLGKGGNITIRIQDGIVADGVSERDPATGLINTSGIGSVVFGLGVGGDINVSAASLRFTNTAQINTSVVGIGTAGNVTIQARDGIFFDGNNRTPAIAGANAFAGIGSVVVGSGQGGNIQVSTGSLSFVGGAQINASAGGLGGIAGNVTIQARDTVLFDGIRTSEGAEGGIFSALQAFSGRGGDVQIEATRLTVANGAQVNTSTRGIDGDGGNIFIRVDTLNVLNGGLLGSITTSNGKAGDVTVQARGTALFRGADTGIVTTSGSDGRGGDVSVTANSLVLGDGAILFSGAAGAGNSGAIAIQAQNNVLVETGSSILTTTLGNGRGGDLLIQADAFTLRDAGMITGTLGSGDSGNLTLRVNGQLELANGTISSGSFFFRDLLVVLQRTGTINQLNPVEVSQAIEFINTLGQNAGTSGDINIEARSIRLNRGSSIAASAVSGKGGNIQLKAQELLLLRRNSTITTQSGILSNTATGIGFGGSGGNITINAPFVVAAPLENSDIIANAFGGAGGRLTINAQGIYWLTPRSRADLERLLRTRNPFELDPQRLPTNDITSFSQSNPAIADQVFINTPDVDPSRGLQQLPSSLIDPAQQVAQTCNSRNTQRAGSFTLTGRGGLPSSPTEPLSDEMGLAEWVAISGRTEPTAQTEQPTQNVNVSKRQQNRVKTEPVSLANRSIVEANGWILDSQGNVTLIAANPTASPATPGLLPVTCN